MIKRLRVSLLAILLACATVLIGEPAYATPDSPDGCQTDPAAPKRQLRGMWLASVVNIDWPSKPGLYQNAVKSEYLGWLDLAASRKLNAIYVQVRPTADAFWPSPLEP